MSWRITPPKAGTETNCWPPPTLGTPVLALACPACTVTAAYTGCGLVAEEGLDADTFNTAVFEIRACNTYGANKARRLILKVPSTPNPVVL